MVCSCEKPALSPAQMIAAANAGSAALRRLLAARMAATVTEPFTATFDTPEYPPVSWFAAPTWVGAWRREHGYPDPAALGGILPLTVTDEGRVGGYFYNAGQCIIHDAAACPGPSPTQYAAFHQNDIVVEGGQHLRVGVIGNTHGHASPWIDWKQAQRHYADPNAQMIVCRAGDDEHGGWIAGAVVPGLTWGDVAMLRRSALSGDWRQMPKAWWSANRTPQRAVVAAQGYDCIGPTLVTRPALPLVTAFTAALTGEPVAILGGLGGVQLASPATLADDCRALAQEVAMEQNRAKVKPGPLMSLLDRAAAYFGMGNMAKGAAALDDAAAEAAKLEQKSPEVLKGLEAKVKALADDARAARAAASVAVEDDSGIVRVDQEVGGMKRTTTIRPDGEIKIVEDAPHDGSALEDDPAVMAAALSGAADLPLAPRDRSWDGTAADMRVRQAASSDGSGDPATIDWSKYGDAFLWRDDQADPNTFGAYKLGFADIVDGHMEAVPAGIFAAAGAVQGARGGVNIPADGQDAVKGRLNGYYAKMASQFADDSISPPWQAADAPGAPAAPGQMLDTSDSQGQDEATDATGPPTREEFEALEARLAAVEEFCSSLLASEMASVLASDEPLDEAALASLGLVLPPETEPAVEVDA